MTHELTVDDTTAMRREGTWRAYLRSEMDRGRQRAATTGPHPQAPAPDSVADVPCPHCSAPAGSRCTTRSGRHRVADPHTARQNAYDTARTPGVTA